jgi:hypothetical protein
MLILKLSDEQVEFILDLLEAVSDLEHHQDRAKELKTLIEDATLSQPEGGDA